MSSEILVLTQAISIKEVIKSILNDSGQDLKMREFNSLNNLIENLRILNYSALVIDLDIIDKDDIKSNLDAFNLDKTILLTSNFSDEGVFMFKNVVTKPVMPGVLKSSIFSILSLAEQDSKIDISLDETNSIEKTEESEHSKGVDHLNIEKGVDRNERLQESGNSLTHKILEPRARYVKPISSMREEMKHDKRATNPVINNEDTQREEITEGDKKDGLSHAVSQFMKRFMP